MRRFKSPDLSSGVSYSRRVPILSPSRIARTAAFSGLLIIVLYSIYAALPLLLGPSLKVTVSKTAWEGASIHGVTKRVSFLEINGAAVPLQEDGTFAVERSFPKGYTAITVSAKDRFGKTIIKQLTFVSS